MSMAEALIAAGLVTKEDVNRVQLDQEMKKTSEQKSRKLTVHHRIKQVLNQARLFNLSEEEIREELYNIRDEFKDEFDEAAVFAAYRLQLNGGGLNEHKDGRRHP